MEKEHIVLDVTNLEDCKIKKDYQAIREIFEEAGKVIDQGKEVILYQTFSDSPPEILERINSPDRLKELQAYYDPQIKA